MKKWVGVVIGLMLVVGAVSVCPAEAAEEPLWKTVLSDAIEHGGFVDSTMMTEALQFAVSNGVSISDFLSEVKAINPRAVEIALKSGFEVVSDETTVLATAAEFGIDLGLAVEVSIKAGVSPKKVIPAAIGLGAATSDVVAGALAGGADSVAVVSTAMASSGDMVAVTEGCLSQQMETADVTAELINQGFDAVEVVSTVIAVSDDPVGVATGAFRVGASVAAVETGAQAAGIPGGTIGVIVSTAQTALEYTTDESTDDAPDDVGPDSPISDHPVTVDNKPQGDVSPN